MGISRGLRIWRLGALVAIGWGLFTITVMHVISSRDPIHDTLSSYITTDPGLLSASVLALAVGSLAVLGALAAGGVPLPRTTRVLLSLWALGLATAAIFPASYPPNPDPTSGEIHLYSCVVAFASLPAAAWTLLEPLRGKAERLVLVRWLRVGAAALVVFGVSFLFARLDEAGLPVHTVTELLPVGATQRLMLIADVALLLGLVRVAVRADATRTATELQPATVRD
ncbi:DUF998 domain-containing protein [Amycolatopsis rhabdoformis]|uniref:DUF998 domain-containing protein n=1 Tax=Amycolatopsis rhabdoformis TaxID=1448059 RepID=A0ABZ1I541_9PSEU|nr:DUF998 domain-containing protein [Amycolatopsis rhabdoformis]WSE28892.1 DUF998 domain-containing protein [Amycolatopsis rhabdoformis]